MGGHFTVPLYRRDSTNIMMDVGRYQIETLKQYRSEPFLIWSSHINVTHQI